MARWLVLLALVGCGNGTPRGTSSPPPDAEPDPLAEIPARACACEDVSCWVRVWDAFDPLARFVALEQAITACEDAFTARDDLAERLDAMTTIACACHHASCAQHQVLAFLEIKRALLGEEVPPGVGGLMRGMDVCLAASASAP